MLPVFVLIIAGLVNILVFLLIILSYTTNILMPFQLIEIIIMVLALGFFDYLENGGICIIEWSENIENALPENTVRVTIEKGEDENSRIITVEGLDIE